LPPAWRSRRANASREGSFQWPVAYGRRQSHLPAAEPLDTVRLKRSRLATIACTRRNAAVPEPLGCDLRLQQPAFSGARPIGLPGYSDVGRSQSHSRRGDPLRPAGDSHPARTLGQEARRHERSPFASRSCPKPNQPASPLSASPISVLTDEVQAPLRYEALPRWPRGELEIFRPTW
jgi:hypothetical protein